ncbi:MAG: response regulator [Planctomycetes bacterium]|nr:response regulator [Planctomycetota bacterium]
MEASNRHLPWASIVAWLAMATGFTVLVGWALHLTPIQSIASGWAPMAPITALSFLLLGASLALASWEPRTQEPQSFGHIMRTSGSLICAAIVAFLAAIRLADYIASSILGEEGSILQGLLDAKDPYARMAPASAACFLLLSAGRFLASNRRHSPTLQVFGVSSGLLAWFGLSHYLFGGEPVFPVKGMAAHTCVMLAVLSSGLLALQPRSGLIALLMSKTAAGVFARRLVPGLLLLPLLFGWLDLRGMRFLLFGVEGGLSLLNLANILVFGTLIWTSAATLEKEEIARRAAEGSATTQQRLIEALTESVPAMVWVKDGYGRYLLANRRTREMLGFDPIGHAEFDSSRESASSRALDDRCRATGASVEAEESYLVGDTVRTYLSIRTPIKFADSGLGAICCFAKDITERKQSERAVRESEERLRTVVENLTEGFVLADETGNCILWNRAAIAMHGFMDETEWKLNLNQFGDRFEVQDGHERILPVERWPLARILKGEVLAGVLIKVRRKDFHWERYFSCGGTTFRDASGRRLGFVTLLDVTDRIHHEDRLNAQLARLDLLRKATKEIAENHDLRGVFHTVAHLLEAQAPLDFCAVASYDSTARRLTIEALGKRTVSIAEMLELTERAHIQVKENGLARCVQGHLVYEPDLATIRFPFPQLLLRGGLRSFVAAPIAVDREVQGVLLAARRLPNSFSSVDCEFLRQVGEHAAFAAHHAEIYEALQRAYDDLRVSHQAAMESERLRALGQMASGIGHDINNALTPIQSYVESVLAHEPGLSPDGRRQLEIALRAAGDIASTVERMREFYRRRSSTIEMVAVDLNRVAREVIELTKARWSDMAQERGVQIEVQLDLAAELPTPLGIESELREALINLVLNAVDAMPSGGKLRLSTRCELESPQSIRRVWIEVCDTGIGMDENTRLRCLEPFFSTKGDRGSGLGLSMVYGIVQRHGADLEIDSSQGTGTCVRIVIPIADEATPPAAASSAAELPARALRILLVDDDPIVLRTLEDLLAAEGHEVEAAPGGEEGVERFDTLHKSALLPDLVLTDLGMPRIDGRKMAAAVKGRSPETPVLLLTGWGQRLDGSDEPIPHVDRVLGKPVKLADLRIAIAALTLGTRTKATPGNA